MSASDAFENSLSLLFFNATTWSNVAINATSSPLTNWELSLHTADPTDSGNQTSSEITYTDYARVAVARTSGGFSVSAAVTTLVANCDFPVGSGGSGTATFFGIGTAHTSTGILEISGAISPTIVTGTGVTPRLTTATSITVS